MKIVDRSHVWMASIVVAGSSLSVTNGFSNMGGKYDSPTTVGGGTAAWRNSVLSAVRQDTDNNHNHNHNHNSPMTSSPFSRRDMLSSTSTGLSSSLAILLGGFMTTTTAIPPEQANAFPNKISDKYDDRPKRPGPKLKDLGVATRKDMVGEEYNGLKPCGPAPNCFCSTDSIEDDPEHHIPAWTWPSHLDQHQAFQELTSVVEAYEPGQKNIDGGGFKIITSDTTKGYLYVQFESLKAGYIDDFEVAYIEGLGDRAVQVRSSSRVGYLDFGVNAKRINYIAKALKAKGWDAPGVDPATHVDYVMQNGGN